MSLGLVILVSPSSSFLLFPVLPHLTPWYFPPAPILAVFPLDIERSWPIPPIADAGGNSLMIVITSLNIERGLALQDMIAGAYDFLQTVELPNQSRIYLLDHLGQCE